MQNCRKNHPVYTMVSAMKFQLLLVDLKTKYFLKFNEVDHRMKMLVFCAALKTFGKRRQTKKCLVI